MENQLEKLLNSLIKKGWIPWGDKRITNVSRKMQYVGTYNWVFRSNHNLVEIRKSTREICSKESGLWQFCCENDLYPPYIQHRWFRDLPTNGLQIHDYRYRVIESALTDESELEKFLLSNIKVDAVDKKELERLEKLNDYEDL